MASTSMGTPQAGKQVLNDPVDPEPASSSVFTLIKGAHQALLQQLGTHGIILTLLASITFVVFLQPPGSFESNGTVRSTPAVQSFLFFSSISFMLACTGILMVWISSASLLRPNFFAFEDPTEKPVQGGPDSRERVLAFDDVPHLCKILLLNFKRVDRLKIYMGSSWLACIAAFICAGSAITESSSNARILVITGICIGGFPFLVEVGFMSCRILRTNGWLGSGTYNIQDRSVTFRLQDASQRHKTREMRRTRVTKGRFQ